MEISQVNCLRFLVHHSLMEGNRKDIIQALSITILLGIYFTLLQASEYFETSFIISDGIYGSTFFIATGFHGLHVIIGSTFLLACLTRQLKFHFTSKHHFGFEAAA
jgi:cytochrome c oxidase subunit 3